MEDKRLNYLMAKGITELNSEEHKEFRKLIENENIKHNL